MECQPRRCKPITSEQQSDLPKVTPLHRHYDLQIQGMERQHHKASSNLVSHMNSAMKMSARLGTSNERRSHANLKDKHQATENNNAAWTCAKKSKMQLVSSAEAKESAIKPSYIMLNGATPLKQQEARQPYENTPATHALASHNCQNADVLAIAPYDCFVKRMQSSPR